MVILHQCANVTQNLFRHLQKVEDTRTKQVMLHVLHW